jgi:hypothetical protein
MSSMVAEETQTGSFKAFARFFYFAEAFCGITAKQKEWGIPDKLPGAIY